MLARITNFSFRKRFPTCLGVLFLPRYKQIELSDPQAIKDLSRFPYMEIEFIEGPANFVRMSINQLRHVATQKGIKGSFFMKKAELIKKLEGQNATV